MRKYFYLFFIVLSTSCSSFLEVDPKASIAGDNVINDQTSANAALNGVYAALRDYYSVNYQSIAYLSGDNVQWTGSQSQIQEFITHKVNPENSTLSSTWVGIYKTINRANNVINILSTYAGDKIATSAKDNILGQAYAIRALAYFDLLRVWGGVPIVTEPTTKVGDNTGVQRSSIDETYKQVIGDLESAESLLPSSTNRFFFTKKTVWALKSRYYLYTKNWEKARDYATLLIDDSSYELLNPYYSFFKNNVVGTKESVFELFYSANEVNPHRLSWQSQTNGGTRQWAPSNDLIAILTNPETAGARSELIAKDNQGRWYGNLYYRSAGEDPTYIIRIAELYLIRAEANAELNAYERAVDDLNKIRERALLKKKGYSSDKTTILLAIEEERRLEFPFEGHRWFDLVRTGRAANILGITDSYRLLLPIPYSQVLADPAISQNPGYSL